MQPAPGAAAPDPEPGPVVLVEGESDAVVVRAVLAARGATADVRPMGGVTNLARFLAEAGGPSPDVLALVDAGEARFAAGALRRHGIRAETAEELAWHGVHVCDRDLEDVLLRALGPDVVLDVVAGMGELGAFASLARMPQWRDRPVTEQLHRFAGSASGRKVRLAARLAERLDPAALPEPLHDLVEAVLASG